MHASPSETKSIVRKLLCLITSPFSQATFLARFRFALSFRALVITRGAQPICAIISRSFLGFVRVTPLFPTSAPALHARKNMLLIKLFYVAENALSRLILLDKIICIDKSLVIKKALTAVVDSNHLTICRVRLASVNTSVSLSFTEGRCLVS